MATPTADIPLSAAGNAALFESIFKGHFKGLHGYACSIVKDEATAEEMVQNVFLKLWERKEQIEIQQSATAYLYRSVYYECLNYLKHAKVRSAHQSRVTHHFSEAEPAVDNAAVKELQLKIHEALKELPEQCRTVFQMSRYEELKYKSIADKLGISVKTVENHIGKALRILRTKLADVLPLILIAVLMNTKN